MTVLVTVLAAFALIDGAIAATPEQHCDVPQSFLASEIDLTHVMTEVKAHRRLDISVVGTGSSALPGPDGAHFAYPARLEQALKQQLPGLTVKVTAHVQSRETTADMAAGLEKVLTDDKPTLVIWQTGTADAMNSVEPEDFRSNLDNGVGTIESGNADVILMNMQYSPHTESMMDVSTYADVMRFVAQQHGALLFDRLGIMRDWNDSGTFDLYTATNNYDMARRVHDCIGRALASQIIGASHLDAVRMQTTR
jgi:lysophospholipase L1-like esterase